MVGRPAPSREPSITGLRAWLADQWARCMASNLMLPVTATRSGVAPAFSK
jgi:hypothetical protein